MKYPIAFAIAFLEFIGIAAGPVTVQVYWNPPASGSPDLYKLYATNDAAAPLNTWPLLTAIPGNVTNASLSLVPGQVFFYLTASNFWGESGPSNITNTPAVLTNASRLQITR
jgi:hypothetical protein